MPDIISRPGMFSEQNPALQLVWDKTSLSTLMFCPQRYKLEILEGWRATGQVDLDFGALFADSIAVFLRMISEGASRLEAQTGAVKYAVENSGDWHETSMADNNVPVYTWEAWGGHYAEQWRCTGTAKYKNEKGNAAKCPISHKGHWEEGPRPEKCGQCGSPTEGETRYIPNDAYKNRHSLIRLIVWYTEEHAMPGETYGLVPLILEDGTPAVEVSFKTPIGVKAYTGEAYTLSGHIDALKSHGPTGDVHENFIAENKTTRKTLGEQFFGGYDPSLDVDVYTLAGDLIFPGLDLDGVVIEGAQIMVDGAAFGYSFARRDEGQREEFFKELQYWLKTAEQHAKEDYWPMRRTQCWLCPFKQVCRMPERNRQMILESNFIRKAWDTTHER
jgi:hypothetical protein